MLRDRIKFLIPGASFLVFLLGATIESIVVSCEKSGRTLDTVVPANRLIDRMNDPLLNDAPVDLQ